MDTVKIHDKEFITSIDHEKISNRIHELAIAINDEYKGKNPLFICVLNGAFMFASDLLKNINFPCEVSFIKVSSYDGVESTGEVKTHIGLNQDITNREIIIIEDIVETGNTIVQLVDVLTSARAKQIKLASLLFKPGCLQHQLNIEYVGFEVPDDFLIGFGLDYNGYGRNLKDLYVLKN